MTTTTAPALSATLIGAIQSFDTSASTPGHGLELLWSRWIDVRQASAAGYPGDPFLDVPWSRVLDLVTEHRAHRDSTRFNVLTAIAKAVQS